jgi:hypothetical protein
MKLIRIAIVLILAAAGCRFAVSHKDVAARRLTEMLLTRLVSLQSGSATVAVAAASNASDASPLRPVQEKDATLRPQTVAPAAVQSVRTVTTNTLCPQGANALRGVAVRRVLVAGQHGGESRIVWIRLILPDAGSCERAKLSGS